MTITEAVGARTDELLKKRHMSRRTFAVSAGLSTGTLSNIYTRQSGSISLATFKAICDGFGMSMSEFLDSDYFRVDCLVSETRKKRKRQKK